MPKPSRYRQDRAERLALSTYLKLTRASDRLWDRLALGLQREGLTPSQFGVLEALFHLGPMCQRDLGERILRSSGNMTLVVGNLDAAGPGPAGTPAEDRRVRPGGSHGAGRAAGPPRLPAATPTPLPGSLPSSHRRSSGPWETFAGSWEQSHEHSSRHRHRRRSAAEPRFLHRRAGLRLVKLTVNFDDPGSYHLYFGDELGRPGIHSHLLPLAGRASRAPRHWSGRHGVARQSRPASLGLSGSSGWCSTASSSRGRSAIRRAGAGVQRSRRLLLELAATPRVDRVLPGRMVRCSAQHAVRGP